MQFDLLFKTWKNWLWNYSSGEKKIWFSSFSVQNCSVIFCLSRVCCFFINLFIFSLPKNISPLEKKPQSCICKFRVRIQKLKKNKNRLFPIKLYLISLLRWDLHNNLVHCSNWPRQESLIEVIPENKNRFCWNSWKNIRRKTGKNKHEKLLFRAQLF